ncbi:hypothetical protein TNCV_1591271 [Trichonephila clavipes]|nr:hypothetical protein TNCV_1591271 [Trichonephila clavipes]
MHLTDWQTEMQQEDYIEKVTHREMHRTARCLLIFITICRNMDDRGDKQNEGRSRVTRTPIMEQNALDTVWKNPYEPSCYHRRILQ